MKIFFQFVVFFTVALVHCIVAFKYGSLRSLQIVKSSEVMKLRMGLFDNIRKVVESPKSKTVTLNTQADIDKQIKQYMGRVDEINKLEASIEKLSDLELKGMTMKLKQRYTNGESLDSLLPTAFAVAREAAWRVLELRHFDVQVSLEFEEKSLIYIF
jgi:hypothetical protein